VTTSYHVVIVGGGPAGLAATIALLRAGLSVLVVERSDYHSPRVGEHLAPSGKPLLASLGLADVVEADDHLSCPGIRSIWGTKEPVDKDYIFHPYGSGLNLARPAFDRSVASRAVALGANIITSAKVVETSRASGRFEIGIAAPQESLHVRAEFVMDASGRNASMAKRFGARPIVYDDLLGIVGQVVGPAPADRLLCIEAVEHGWWYSAVLASGVVTTFLTDPDLVDTSRAGRAAAWREQLRGSVNTSTRMLAGQTVDEIHTRTARTQRLDAVAGDAWVATGDAAMSFDPLSSDGISKGLEWGRKAAEVAAAWCRGDHSAAKEYQHNVEKCFSEYLVTRYRYYAAEKRWPDSPFWRRRHAAPSPAARMVH